jgi:hypothetical protein
LTVIFQDSFESGDFSAWSSTKVNTGCSLIVESTNPHHGSKNLRADTAGSVDGEAAVAVKEIGTAYTHAYARAYVKFPSIPSGASRLFPFIGFWQAAEANCVARAGVGRDSGGNARWGVRYYSAGAFTTAFGSSTPAPDVWYCIELEVEIGTTASVKLYVDGALEIEVTNVDNSARPFGVVRCGIDNLWGGAAVVTVYADSVAIADSYIGTSEEFPTPTPTPGPSAPLTQTISSLVNTMVQLMILMMLISMLTGIMKAFKKK